jgi:hypothetical protein
MDDGFTPEEREEDPATMVTELGQRLDRETLARLIGVKPSELDMIGAGHAPKAKAAERLRLLYELSAKTDDLDDPAAVMAALGPRGGSRGMFPFALVPRLRRYVLGFLLLDTLVFVGFLVLGFLLR